MVTYLVIHNVMYTIIHKSQDKYTLSMPLASPGFELSIPCTALQHFNTKLWKLLKVTEKNFYLNENR